VTKDGRPKIFKSNAAASETRQVPYRAIARAIRELGSTVRHVEAKQELELLALRYQRLAEFREELSLLCSLRQPRPAVDIQFARSRHR
jgi:hypothetical protein